MAMADAPSVFSLPPWGYRILVPWLVRMLPMATADGFKLLSLAGLTLAGGLLFVFLRRLGHGAFLSLVAVFVYGLSAPVTQAVSCPFLVEPVTLAIVLALLIGIEGGAGVAPLALLAVLGALSKEATLVLLPVIYFARRDRDGDKRAAMLAILSALPSLALVVLLRAWWAPAPVSAPVAEGTLWLALYRVLEHWPDWWRSLLLGGLLPVSVVGALRPRSRPLMLRYGYFLAVTLALPFVASVYTGDPSVPFFADDIPRLLIYALPLLFALALQALDVLIHHVGVAPPPFRYRTRTALILLAATVALVVLPGFTQDRYRRADLSGPRDGRHVLAFSRESLAVASRLALGRQVDFEPERRSFVVGKTVPALLGRMRWFLRDGWGARPQYGDGPVVTQAAEATLLLPCLQAEDWNVTLVASASAAMRVHVVVNGHRIGEIATAPEPARSHLVVPGGALFRGDNEVRLIAEAPGLRLRELRIRPAR
jgi:hypothetical protein